MSEAADWWGRTPLWSAVEIRNLDLRSGATENGDRSRGGAGAHRRAHRPRARTSTRASRSSRRSAGTCCRWARSEWVDFTGQTPFIRAAQSGRRAGDAAAAGQGRRPEHHHVQRHHRAHGGGRRELGGRADLQRVAGHVARRRAALSGARRRSQRGQRDGTRGGARRGQPRIRRHHRAAGARGARTRRRRTRKAARR